MEDDAVAFLQALRAAGPGDHAGALVAAVEPAPPVHPRRAIVRVPLRPTERRRPHLHDDLVVVGGFGVRKVDHVDAAVAEHLNGAHLRSSSQRWLGWAQCLEYAAATLPLADMVAWLLAAARSRRRIGSTGAGCSPASRSCLSGDR